MNNQLFLILFWILASCVSPVSTLYQDERISVISAEKNEWIGGRQGVRGIMYTLQLKKKGNDNRIIIKTLWAEGNKVSFSQSDVRNIIIIRGNLPYKNAGENASFENTQIGAPIENTGPPKINPKDNWVEYTVKGSKTSSRINISKFTSVKTSEESFP